MLIEGVICDCADEEAVKPAYQDVQGTYTMGVKNGGPGPPKDVEEVASMERVEEVVRDLESSWRKEIVEGQETVEGQDVCAIGDSLLLWRRGRLLKARILLD